MALLFSGHTVIHAFGWRALHDMTIAMTVFQNAMGQAKWGAISAYDACLRADGTSVGFDIPFETVDATNVSDYLE